MARIGLSILTACFFMTFGIPSYAGSSTPHLVDNSNSLSPPAKSALEKILSEHKHLADDDIRIAIFGDLNGKSDEDAIQSVAPEIREDGNFIILAVFMDESNSAAIVGYRIDPILSSQKMKEILNDWLSSPDKDNLTPSLYNAVLDILETLDSPLIESGKAHEIMDSTGINYSEDIRKPMSFWLFLFLGAALLLALSFHWITAIEYHYANAGVFKPNPMYQSWIELKTFLKTLNAARKGGSKVYDDLGGASGNW